MRDYISLGSTPCDERCVQVSKDSYLQEMRKECTIYVDQLRRRFPQVLFGIKSFPHDFGSYLEAVAYFDDENSAEAAFEVEANIPQNWDEVSVIKLSKI